MIESLLNTSVVFNGKTVKVSSLSPELQTDYLIEHHFDILKSKEAKLWRICNLYYITDKDGKKVLFAPNESQLDLIDKILSGYRRIIILKSRQLGFTTLMSIWLLDEVIWNPNTEALQVAHTKIDAEKFFNKKIIYAVRNLYPCVKAQLTMGQAKASRQQFDYPDGSVSGISVANSARSGTYQLVHISELGKLAKLYQERANEVVTGTLPAVGVNGLVVIESTAEGASGLFFEMFMDSWKNKQNITPVMTKAVFYPVFYNWRNDKEEIRKSAEGGSILASEMPECEINWEDFQKEYSLSNEELNYFYLKWIGAQKDVDKLHQEYPTHPMEAFLSSGSPYFSSRRVADLLDKTTKDYTRWSYINNELIEDPLGDWYIYEEPKVGKHYVLSGDVAQGLLNGDYSACFVLGYDKQIKAYYQGHIEPDDFSKMVQLVGKKYNTAMLAIEFNADGNWVNTDVHNSGYPNIYLRTSVDDITKEVTKAYGWLTSKKTRDFMLGEAKKHFNVTEINCKALLEEMLVFVRNKRGRPEAASGKFDDLVMSYAIAVAVLQGREDKTDLKEELPSIAKLLWS